MAVEALPPLRWAVLHVDLEPVIGHEQGGERRVLVVSYEPFHRSGRITVCPITAARDKPLYPNEVAIPVGIAGQTRPGLILCHRVRTISILRAGTMLRRGGPVLYVTNRGIRAAVRRALRHQLGLDIPEELDGAKAGD